MLTPTLRQILHEMKTNEDDNNDYRAEIVCDKSCWLGDRRIQRKSVYHLLEILAISDRSDEGGLQRYRINDTGRAILRNPEIIQEILNAIEMGGSFTIENDHVVRI